MSLEERITLGVLAVTTIFFLAGTWVGYRLGVQHGLSIWRKSYSFMTPDDIKKHKRIIGQMDSRLDQLT